MKDEQDEFERDLEQALRPVNASAGFVQGVMMRVQAPASGLRLVSRKAPGLVPRPIWRWVGGAVAATLLVGTGFGVEQARQQRQRATADRQFNLAMQITAHALEDSQEQLNRAGVRFVDVGND